MALGVQLIHYGSDTFTSVRILNPILSAGSLAYRGEGRAADMNERISLDGLEIIITSSDLEVIRRHPWALDTRGEPSTRIINPMTLGRVLLGNPTAKVMFRDGNCSNYSRENIYDGSPEPRKRLTKARHSQYKGVTTSRGRYLAQIREGLKNKFIGRYDTPEEAARAYDREALRIYGEKAVLNNVSRCEV